MRRSFEERKSKKEFRMNIINRIKDLTPKERARVIEEILAQKYTIPYSTKDEISKSTIYRWLREFRENPDAEAVLMGKARNDRGVVKVLHEKQKDAAKNPNVRISSGIRAQLCCYLQVRTPKLSLNV